MSKTPRSIKGWIAFNPNKNWLELLDDHYVSTIINRALDGEMTLHGAKLLLIPDRREGRKDTCSTYRIGKVRKSECISVEELVRRIRRDGRVTDKARNTKFRACKNRGLQVESMPNSSPPTRTIIPTEITLRRSSSGPSRNGCFTCGRSLHSKRSDAKFCGNACRQRSYRRSAKRGL